MKKLLRKFILVLALMSVGTLPLVQTGCSTAPSSRVNQVQTLKIVGTSAKASLDTAAVLLREGKITVEQFQKVATFYDKTWQPAFALAVTAVQSDLSSLASPDIIGLAAQLAALVAQLTTK